MQIFQIGICNHQYIDTKSINVGFWLSFIRWPKYNACRWAFVNVRIGSYDFGLLNFSVLFMTSNAKAYHNAVAMEIIYTALS